MALSLQINDATITYKLNSSIARLKPYLALTYYLPASFRTPFSQQVRKVETVGILN